ncbi:MAG: hypothetical protein HC828_04675 [Blastochloris sp.]|nr:hypothetical protein [Blastochloris sp.]
MDTNTDVRFGQPTPTPGSNNRGKIQIQGHDIRGHPNAVRDTISQNWDQPTPITVAEGLAILDRLWLSLTRKQQKRRQTVYERARRYIQSGPPSGHRNPGKGFTSPDSEQDRVSRGTARIDVVIDAGVAFDR